MANATVQRFGANNGGGDKTELFLKVFGGEVMVAFEEANVSLDKHTIRTISSGKSAQFPATWKVSASYHTPGAEIVGQASNVSERVIAIDDLLIADVFLANIDEAMSHYETRSTYARECGLALAYKWDRNVMQVMVNAARASATVSGGNGGTSLTSSGTLYKTSATDLAAGIYAAVQAMDEKDVPEMDAKWCFVKPAQYYLLAQSTQLINRDWAGAGSYAAGKILAIGGAMIVKSNHVPSTNIASGPTAYQGDFTKVAAIIATDKAVGTVKLLDLALESEYDTRRQGTLIVAKYAVGHGILRPECAAELKTTS